MVGLSRDEIFPEKDLPTGHDLLVDGAFAASDWVVGQGAFQRAYSVQNEIDYKTAMMSEGRVMQHAHLGYRSLERTLDAIKSIHTTCSQKGARVDRIGLCLDWSMGYPQGEREKGMRGTGVLLNRAEDFSLLTEAAPIALHFGDFMLGFPGAFENTKYALAAGATTIGNLGQYFTFRLPGDSDDIRATQETVRALGLIAAQKVPVLVHSNLDDGFAAVFHDLTSAIGCAIVERRIIVDLIGAPYAVCYGHHFTEPVTRMAFQRAIGEVNKGTPGSQVYGATVLYRGEAAENYASLSSYLLSDVVGQITGPTGHAVNPVPVTENKRIPDIDEIIDAQLFLHRMSELAPGYVPILNTELVDETAQKLYKGGHQFAEALWCGFQEMGINIDDPFEVLLAMRRIGGRRLEQSFGVAQVSQKVPATTFIHLQEHADKILNAPEGQILRSFGKKGLCVLLAASDVHEHGKELLRMVFDGAGITCVDGGVSAEPDDLAKLAVEVDAIAISTYNGVALTFANRLSNALAEKGISVPVFFGGRLNQVPEDSNSSLPVDVEPDLRAKGILTCKDVSEFASEIQKWFGRT
ncbi:cobalamin-dependent protein [Cochlodiniinecator piscidefendens]|uniref:cobalamin-dependent protein n=1 Tax=Cochlodiniinecator piscidefendens TaxID=2715756 RepID=UPI00140D135C|nr:cobalamin-dependent protein [Cochlodiniinecator piscidefendens]